MNADPSPLPSNRPPQHAPQQYSAPRQPLPPGPQTLGNTPAPGAYAPAFVAPDTINEFTPVEVANGIIRRQAKRTQNWAVTAGVTATVAALLTWASFYTPGGVSLISVLSGAVVGAVELLYLLWAAILLVLCYRLLLKLRDRAVHYRPPIARTATDIHAMHLWPVRNMFGPVQALVETGVVAARGPGRLLWPVGCVSWVIGLAWLWFAEAARGHFQALIVLAISAACIAATANLLGRALAPEESNRLIPLGSPRGKDDAFWSKGIIETATRPAPTVVDLPIDDGIEEYYRRED